MADRFRKHQRPTARWGSPYVHHRPHASRELEEARKDRHAEVAREEEQRRRKELTEPAARYAEVAKEGRLAKEAQEEVPERLEDPADEEVVADARKDLRNGGGVADHAACQCHLGQVATIVVGPHSQEGRSEGWQQELDPRPRHQFRQGLRNVQLQCNDRERHAEVADEENKHRKDLDEPAARYAKVAEERAEVEVDAREDPATAVVLQIMQRARISAPESRSW